MMAAVMASANPHNSSNSSLFASYGLVQNLNLFNTFQSPPLPPSQPPQQTTPHHRPTPSDTHAAKPTPSSSHRKSSSKRQANGAPGSNTHAKKAKTQPVSMLQWRRLSLVLRLQLQCLVLICLQAIPPVSDHFSNCFFHVVFCSPLLTTHASCASIRVASRMRACASSCAMSCVEDPFCSLSSFHVVAAIFCLCASHSDLPHECTQLVFFMRSFHIFSASHFQACA